MKKELSELGKKYIDAQFYSLSFGKNYKDGFGNFVIDGQVIPKGVFNNLGSLDNSTYLLDKDYKNLYLFYNGVLSKKQLREDNCNIFDRSSYEPIKEYKNIYDEILLLGIYDE